MKYYHCNMKTFKTGDVVTPGNWGKLIYEFGISHSSWKREMALEAVRAWEFPQKPSRLFSTFCCDNIETIKFYHTKIDPNSNIYEVEFVDEKAPKHKGDFNAVEPMARCNKTMLEIAKLYWEYGFKI